MPGPETGPNGEDLEGPERGMTPERTKESEIKANVEFWQELGIEVDEKDVREKVEALPEVEGFDWYIYMPKGVGMSQLLELYQQKSALKVNIDKGYLNDYFYNEPKWDERITLPRSSKEESYVIAAKHQLDPDHDSLAFPVESPKESYKTLEDWDKTGDEFMSPPEMIVADLQYLKENGYHLNDYRKGNIEDDQVNVFTYFPGTHLEARGSRDVIVGGSADVEISIGVLKYQGMSGKYYQVLNVRCGAHSHYGKHKIEFGGIRRIVTKNTNAEELRAAEQERDHLNEIGIDAALKLNQDYKRLLHEYNLILGRKERAEQTLADFRREQLGMKKPEEEKKPKK